MADNPFAKYASPVDENPFAKYTTAPSATTGAQRSYSLTEVPIEAGKNLPASAGKFVGGVVHAITHPIQTLNDLTLIGGGALRESLPKSVVRFIDKFDSDPVIAERASAMASAVGGMYKDRYGNYESIKRTFAEDPVGAAADLSTLLTGTGAIASKTGAARSGAALSKAGAAINPMRPLVPLVEVPVKLAAKGVSAAYNAMSPKSAAYLAATEGRAQEIVNALRKPNEIVPGSKPTAAQAASSVGATRFSALGASAADANPTPYFEFEQAQKAAQLAALRKVGKTPSELTSAEKLRADTAKELYAVSDKTLVATDRVFEGLLKRPSMNKVIARASELAAEKGIPFRSVQASETPPSKILNSRGEPIGMTAQPAQSLAYPGSSLHMMKMAFDDLTRNPERFGIGASEVNAISATRGKFLEWVEGKVPSYKEARGTFSAQSAPINQMQVGQFLEGKLIPALGEESSNLRAAGYASALADAPGTIKRSTGQPRYSQLSEVMTPEQMAILDSVHDDLARIKLTDTQASRARSSGASVKTAGSGAVGEIKAPHLLTRITTIANDILNRMQGKLDQKLAIELAVEMLDPALAAKAIEKALARQAKGKKMAEPFMKTGKAIASLKQAPAVVNVLAPYQQPENDFIR